MDLSQVIELFESKHSAELADRHAQSITLMCEEMKYEYKERGFYFREMDQIQCVLSHIHAGLTKGKVSQFIQFFELFKSQKTPFFLYLLNSCN